ncbi:MAG: L,D-transpeptidase [Oscillospiraceae bacterium]|nr:L,D-transpeptidase [Oscillospiraceae bacterium]
MPSSTDSGTYTVTVTATDPSGNSSSMDTTLSIGEKPAPPPEPEPVQPSQPAQPSSGTPYSISINRAQNTVTISQRNENNEYVPFKAFVCSTGGSNTPLGNFKLGQRYLWLPLYGGVYGQYTIRIHGSIAFHSVPYYTQDKSDLEYEEYNKLGSTASAGCVRLCVQDVKWIYENCEAGTPVTIYDGDDPGPLGKPSSIQIDINSPNRGWDPTDPDPANPWNQ